MPSKIVFLVPQVREVPRGTGSMRAPSCELWRSLAKFGEPHATFIRPPFTFTGVPAKVPRIHQSSQNLVNAS